MQDRGTDTKPDVTPVSQVALVTSLIWLVVAIIVGVIAYRQGEYAAVHCIEQFGVGC